MPDRPAWMDHLPYARVIKWAEDAGCWRGEAYEVVDTAWNRNPALVTNRQNWPALQEEIRLVAISLDAIAEEMNDSIYY